METKISYYSRGNVGNRDFNNTLLEAIADKVQELLKDYDYFEDYVLSELDGEIIECDNNEYTLVWDEDKNKLFVEEDCGIEIYVCDDEIILEDNCLSNGCSWGYDKITISEDTWYDRAEEAEKAIVEFLKTHDNWRIEWLDGGEYAIGMSAESCGIILDNSALDFEYKDVISKEDAIDLVEHIFSYLANCEPQEGPICSNNPYAWGQDDFEWEIDGDTVTIKTQYLIGLGAEDHLCEECIKLVKTDDKPDEDDVNDEDDEDDN